ncbi:hypothetical protein PHYSODRAFT_327775 [Phytophthora sojae]|uniref:G domain-containing protein n=1 Tax=Phytophthora sojae (strain P6497) TaxID=1094619 RepID=G4Z6I1_PHYSP|nr:hypothetical protein PHYSODRAFT_327775 [Phytophthora sojae]EGZ19551.1 hypothetical protein PHYSODRAFT_327775 [Phytophthora sojae]|eukprot:XP_009522268.1 hypothetical protein PHYSODRAFT_327775 [Phytophthora sojae]
MFKFDVPGLDSLARSIDELRVWADDKVLSVENLIVQLRATSKRLLRDTMPTMALFAVPVLLLSIGLDLGFPSWLTMPLLLICASVAWRYGAFRAIPIWTTLWEKLTLTWTKLWTTQKDNTPLAMSQLFFGNLSVHPTQKLVGFTLPGLGDFQQREDDAGDLLFGAAARHVQFEPQPTKKKILSDVQLVGIFGLQKTGKSTLCNALYGLKLRAGNSRDKQTTVGIDLTIAQNYGILDTEGADGPDAKRVVMDRLNALVDEKDKQFVYDYSTEYRDKLELAFMVVAVAVCSTVIYCFDSTNAVDAFANKVAAAASKLSARATKPVLVAVLNKCTPEELDEARNRDPSWFANVRASPKLQSVFSGIECINVPDFRESSDQYHSQVKELRELIDNPLGAQPLEVSMNIVQEVIKEIQTSKATETIDTVRMREEAEAKLRDEVLSVLKDIVEGMVTRGRGYSWPEIALMQDNIISRHLSPFKLTGNVLTSVQQGLLLWLRSEFNEHYRYCGLLCGCALAKPCTLVVHHEEKHRCSTHRFTCAHGCALWLGCGELKCDHCPVTCATHSSSLCTVRGEHEHHKFLCKKASTCEGCEKPHTRKTLHCEEQNLCAQCSCTHAWGSRHHPKGGGRGLTNCYWECTTPNCFWNNDASLYQSIADEDEKNGVQLNEGMKSAIRGGFMEVVKVLVVGFPELKTRLEDVFGYYTNPGGVLHVPMWANAASEYQENDPRAQIPPY